MPARVWDGGYSRVHHKKALLVVGSHPGVNEDRQGKCFVDRTGVRTNLGYIKATGFHNFADCFLTNAVRCTPNGVTVTDSHVKACRKHLEQDVAELAKCYEQVVVLATGEKAVTAVLGKKCSLPSFKQGISIKIGETPVVVFATYLAAILEDDKEPAKLNAIKPHLFLVREFLENGTLRQAVQVPVDLVGDNVPDPPPNTARLSLDIETYGCVGNQTVFHPAKSMAFDGVKRDDLILTVGLAWRDPESDEPRVKVYRMNHLRERLRLLRVLKSQENLVILGQNIQFDLLYLRSFDEAFASVLCEDKCKLQELAVLNFLEDDQRIERSLKNLSLVLLVANYNEERSLKAGEKYSGPEDPVLWHYNAKDCLATLLNAEVLESTVLTRYGESTPKWAPASQAWFNDLLWLTIDMSENGVEYDRDALWELNDRLTKHAFTLFDCLKERGLQPGGKGSQKAIDEFFHRVYDKLFPPDVDLSDDMADICEQVEFTDKGKLCTGRENMQLFLGALPIGDTDRRLMKAFRRFKRTRKIVDSYTSKLLGIVREKKKQVPGDWLVFTRAHPTWYPVPSRESDNSNDEGGTKQGRITPKGPALQTQPKAVEHCQVSRFKHGCLLYVDGSQIELRIGAAWSGDPVMLEYYRKGLNLHALTASRFAGFEVNKKQHPILYAAGKELNFARMFRACALTLQMSLRRKAGLEAPLEQLEQFLKDDLSAHPTFYAWQEALLNEVRRTGMTVLPEVGISRTYLPEEMLIHNQKSRKTAHEAFVSAVVNFPIQSVAALSVISAQVALRHWMRSQGLRSLTISNTYDEGIYDVHDPDELAVIIPKALEIYRRPPLYDRLVAAGHLHDCPLDAEYEVRQ